MTNTSRVKPLFYTGILITGLFFSAVPAAIAQSPFKGLENLFTVPDNYVIHHVDTPPVIDGDINDAVWQKAAWTAEFQDIEGDLKPKPYLKTQVKMLWDDSCLYIAAKLQEPNLWAYQTHHDDIVYYDNDFEIFINPNNTTHQYFEIEVNAINTLFDLFLNKPYNVSGNPMVSWDAAGMRSVVKVQGTVNNASDTDRGWTVEMAIPFRSISTGWNTRPPKDSTLWRINFSRVEWDTKAINGKYVKDKDSNGNNKPEHNWVWSPQGLIAMHMPERWGYLLFTKSNDNVTFTMPYAEQQKRYLWLIYYREKEWFRQHGEYALSLDKLGLTDRVTVNEQANTLQLEATKHQFMGLITDDKDKITWTINQEGLIQSINYRSHE
ncbi:Carbohydrate family 9 binding domain-like [Mucilaginibacter mallensis]|uniref:Carbohydrate family 9 binding domain-like n=1 Tax=Mucilaginibacter mallensis TaxID=652787 RepID=A0A1H1TSK8_MUCMA|nr:carbohydrate-binding family 9-like protein [Mucilaginibacter mallensis]SDS63305.1 Carbohydrate family 9 binding domain-like [Mucilaginibacter mallensis]